MSTWNRTLEVLSGVQSNLISMESLDHISFLLFANDVMHAVYLPQYVIALGFRSPITTLSADTECDILL